MVLAIRRWGTGAPSIVCVHGLTMHGGVFAGLGERLAEGGHSVVAVDLRGHGDSGRLPPWNVDAHVADLLETLDALGAERVTFVGHSFGGRVVATLASRSAERVRGLALLDPALDVSPEGALRGAEIDRLDWSFATVEGAVNALLSSDSMTAPPRHEVEAFTRADVRTGPDGRYRFSCCPSATVVAWSEMSLPPPPIAELPTLLLRPEVPLFDAELQARRYREALGELLVETSVPNGHNMLWEAPEETAAAVERFLAGR